MSNYTAVNSCASSEPVTLDSIKAKVYELDRKFPKSKRAVKVRCSPKLAATLRDLLTPRPSMMTDLFGLPVEIDLALPYPAYAVEFADGFEEVHCGDMLPIRLVSKVAEATP